MSALSVDSLSRYPSRFIRDTHLDGPHPKRDKTTGVTKQINQLYVKWVFIKKVPNILHLRHSIEENILLEM